MLLDKNKALQHLRSVRIKILMLSLNNRLLTRTPFKRRIIIWRRITWFVNWSLSAGGWLGFPLSWLYTKTATERVGYRQCQNQCCKVFNHLLANWRNNTTLYSQQVIVFGVILILTCKKRIFYVSPATILPLWTKSLDGNYSSYMTDGLLTTSSYSINFPFFDDRTKRADFKNLRCWDIVATGSSRLWAKSQTQQDSTESKCIILSLISFARAL